MTCPKCNANEGFYTRGTFYQFYDENLEPAGYSDDAEEHMLHCAKCHARFRKATIKRLIQNNRKD